MKKQTSRLLICLGYLLLFAPFIYSIYFSMPANDDFALALNWWGKGIVGEAFTRAGWNYMNWFGQSGILAILVQVLFNPLHWFNNVGYSFGLCMLVWNGLIIYGIINGIKRIINCFVIIEDKLKIEFATLLITAIITSGYYYSDVYNWWSGLIGYALLMMVAVQCIAFTFEYNHEQSMRKYIGMILLGVCACTSLMLCAPVGVMYLFVTFIWGSQKNTDGPIKKIFPFICFLIAGISTAIAPGNFTRLDSKETSGDRSVLNAIFVSIYKTHERIANNFLTKTWIIGLLAIIVIVGLSMNKETRIRIRAIIIGSISSILAAIGALLPYAYGQSKRIDSEFAPRAWYVVDYVLWIGLAISVFALGIYLATIVNGQKRVNLKRIVIAVVLGSFILPLFTRSIKGENHIDIIRNGQLIKESNTVWNDIFDEMKSPESGQEVEVVRKTIPWSQYVYYPGINEEKKEPITDNDGYANCNQSAAKYFGKRRVSVIFE